ncbi:hypothetical protein TRFO_38785 [Tritrichomonas foetus]|uniref:BSD domain-containing protein n=1 Tax=Tritrichomonas foetus TaxID=1144522 RepID=A0A1J4J9Z9_9EUKA|nr:hypothetical protein TRFO_38785 [Tritrichomonas foetus]|eukprot:OHS95047.1 hypothetical protein TRFO_38785 [Tritrichomonas foetus]
MTLDPGEEEILSKKAIFEKEKVQMILTTVRLLIAKGKKNHKFIYYNQIEKIRYTKKDVPNPDEKTSVRFQVKDAHENKMDIAFKGVDSITNLNETIKILKQKKEEAHQNTTEEKHETKPSKSQSKRTEFDVDVTTIYQATKQTDTDIKAQILLNKDFSIAKDLFDRLVQEKVISSDYFWSNYRSELANQASIEDHQQNGYSGRFLSEVTADSKSRGNQFSFTINSSIKRQILRKKPQIFNKYLTFLKERYDDQFKGLNPEDESFFWQQYFSAQLFDLSAKSQRKKKKENMFSDIPLQDSITFNEKARNRRMLLLEPSVRPESLYEMLPGGGQCQKELLPHTFQSTVDAYNIHSELSLIDNGIIPDTTRDIPDLVMKEEPLKQHQQLDDLIPQKVITYKPLNIVQTVAKPIPEKIEPNVFRVNASQFAANLSDFANSFTRIPQPSEPDMRNSECILRDLTGDINIYVNYHNMNSQNRASLSEIRNFKAESQILLFQFWTAYLDPKRKDDAIKLKDKIAEFRTKIESYKTSIPKADSARAITPLIDEIEESVDAVLRLYDTQGKAKSMDDLMSTDLDKFFFG